MGGSRRVVRLDGDCCLIGGRPQGDVGSRFLKKIGFAPKISCSEAVRRVRESIAMSEFRVEKDSMGEVRVPAEAYYGAQTQRAVDNFPISGQPMPARLIRTLGLVKLAPALADRHLRPLKPDLAAPTAAPARIIASAAPPRPR